MDALGHNISADTFLSVKTARAGLIKGEAGASGHEDQITLRSWRWGMAANTDAALRSGTTSRRSLRALIVDKSFDRASTGLMNALATNDNVKEAVLTMRKAGDSQQDFLKITLKDAQLQDIDYVADDTGKISERLTFSYARVDVEYRVQQAGGQVGATTTFNAES